MATGSIERLPSGKYRAVLYVGLDPVTGTRTYLKGSARMLREDAVADLDLLRARALAGDGHTSARFAAVLERYLETADLSESTRVDYRRRVNRVIAPRLGHKRLDQIDVPLLQEFQNRLLRCSLACDGTGSGHRCRPLSANAVRHYRAVISGALTMAARYGWIGHNPSHDLEPPRLQQTERIPPTAEQVAAAVTHAFEQDIVLGMILWLIAITGAHRGEILRLRFSDIDFDATPPRLALGPSYIVLGGKPVFTAGKRRSIRYVALDAFTLHLLTEYQWWMITTLGEHRATGNALMFPGMRHTPGDRPRNPDAVTHGIARLARELGFHLTPTLIRHYNATELLDAGLSVRTVAGRLGHADGGATLLCVYAHATAASDQNAANVASSAITTPAVRRLDWRLHFEPTPHDIQPHPHAKRPKAQSARAPYELIAKDIRAAIDTGRVHPGDPLPPIKELARWYGHSASTIHRALRLLADEQLLILRTGHRTRVRHRPASES
jgi:integrase